MEEPTINKLYIEKPDKEVKLLCSYTTRREGFLDILLSKQVLTSDEVHQVLGKTKTHRGSSMSSGGVENFCRANNYISFSTGFVSFKYSNPSFNSIEDYVGGLGIIVPLEKLLKYPFLEFSHCSDIGGIKNYNLNKDNIASSVHIARKQGNLNDDGFGNLFEIQLKPKLRDSSNYLSVISYPKVKLDSDVCIAIPTCEKKIIETEIKNRQKDYKIFLDKIKGKNIEEIRDEKIDGRDLFYIEKMIPFIEKIIEPFNIENLPITWYNERNLDLALKRIAIS